MLLRLENITRYFPEVDLFEEVNLQVNEGDRIGLVGPNGSGKSQLLGIMAGAIHPDAGRVENRSRLRIGKLDQEVRANPQASLLAETMEVLRPVTELETEMERLAGAIATAGRDEAEVLLSRYSAVKEQFEQAEGYSCRQRAEAVLLGLGFSLEDLAKPCRILSGGQLNRLGLARLLLQKPELMLLDEPTNHLDLAAIRWLEGFLQSWDRAFVVVSHDRYFLDRVVDQVWEINNRRISSWPGNYSKFQADRHKRIDQQRREYETQRQFIEKNEEFIRRNIYGQKTRQAQSRQRMLEKLELRERPSGDQKSLRLNLADVPRSSGTILVLQHLAAGYGRPLLTLPLEMTIVRGDRVAIVGDNGTGKTTFFRTILGQLPPCGGSCQWGRNISVGYFDQKMEALSGSPLQEIRLLDPLAGEAELRTFLARFGFHDDDVFKPLAALSGGEKNRLLLARLVYEKHNVLILDEPTNHLDILSREELEEALREYPGTLFVITHDRYFLDKIVTKILFVQGNKLEYFYGQYSDWEKRQAELATRAKQAEAAAVRERAPVRPAAGEREKPATLSKNERFRFEKMLEEVEAAIAGAEERQRQIELRLQNPDPSLTPAELTRLGQEHTAVEQELAGLLARWEEVAAKLEQGVEAGPAPPV